jgi:hypothetical protein
LGRFLKVHLRDPDFVQSLQNTYIHWAYCAFCLIASYRLQSAQLGVKPSFMTTSGNRLADRNNTATAKSAGEGCRCERVAGPHAEDGEE